jgi:hypothetical protein
MSHSRRQTPSLDYREVTDVGWQPSRDPLLQSRMLRAARWLTRQPALNTPDRGAERPR